MSWPQTTLGALAARQPNAIVDGPFGSNLKLSDYVECGVPVLQGKNITGNKFVWSDVRFIHLRKATELKRSAVRVGDILIVKIGSIGYSAEIGDLNGHDFAIIPANLAKITVDTDLVDKRFLIHWLKSPGAFSYLSSVASKTAQPALSLGKIKAMPVPLPPLDDQRRIAATLDKAEELRTKRRATITLLDQLPATIYLQMFGDPASNQHAWPLKLFGTVCDTRLGKMLDKNKQSSDTPLPYVGNSNVQWFRLDLTSLSRMTFTDRERETLSLKSGDVLICEGGEPGRAAIWRDDLSNCYFQKAIHRARPDTSRLNPEYLTYCMYLLAHGGGLKDYVTSATIAHLTGEKLRTLPLPLPPIDFQQRFAVSIQAINRAKTAHQSAVAKLDAIFASLQAKAFGESV